MGRYKVDQTTGELTLIAGSTLWADTPIGMIQSFGGSAIPSGWLLCNGAEKNKTDYPELYAVIGDAFGTASVNTKFVLPDLREATTKGVGLTGLSNNHMDADGLALGEFIDDQLQDHQHKADLNSAGSSAVWALTDTTGRPKVAQIGNVTGARYGDTTEVKAVGVNYIIKAKQVALPADLEAQVEEAVEETIGWTLIKKVTSSSSYSTTFAIPNNYNELLAVCGTPYYQFSDVIPQSIMDSSGQFSGYHQTGFTGSSMSQQYCYTLSANGNFTSPTVIQNGADNAGFFALYYR